MELNGLCNDISFKILCKTSLTTVKKMSKIYNYVKYQILCCMIEPNACNMVDLPYLS